MFGWNQSLLFFSLFLFFSLILFIFFRLWYPGYRPPNPSLKLGSDEIAIVLEHKHLGVIIDSKLNFKSHIKEAIVKAWRGIGIIRHISRYVSREVLDQVYKLYVRPHLDIGDIVYQKYDPKMKLDVAK